MWEINNSLQLLGFARSVGLGVALSLLYDILRICRKVCHPTAVRIFSEDIIYSFLSAIITFLFLLSLTGGELRGFVFLGMCIGFVVCRITLSQLIFRIGVWIFSRLKRLFSFVSAFIYGCFDRFEVNTVKFLKKVLKKVGSLLYTKKNEKEN